MNKPFVQTTQIIITDNTALFAEGIEQIINNIPGFAIMAKAPNGKILMKMLNRLRPDIILLDIKMPVMDGLETALLIKKNYPEIKIILISLYFESNYKMFIQKNNIEGFIGKDIGFADLKEALQKVKSGQRVFIPSRESETAELNTSFDFDYANIYKLTKTEIEIIKLIAHGDTTKIIADKRGLSKFTIEVHRKNILRKLHAKNMAEVAAFAAKQLL